MHVTREGPDLHGLVTVLSTHSVRAKPLTHGQPGGWEWRSSKEYLVSSAASILTRIFTSQRSSTTGSDHWNAILRHNSAGLSPNAGLDALLRVLQRSESIDRQLWCRAPALHATSKVTVLEVTTPDKQDRRRRGKNDDLDAQNAAHAALQAADRDAANRTA